MVVQDEINIKGSSIIKNPIAKCPLCSVRGATFVKKNSCLVARIISFDTVGLYLLTLHMLEPYPSKDILTLIALL